MKEISLGAMDQFAQYGGLLGMVIYALIAIVAGVFVFLVWFIKSDRENKNNAQKHSSEQYEKRLKEEAHLANSVSEIAMSVNVMAMEIRSITMEMRQRPCIGIDEEFFEKLLAKQEARKNPKKRFGLASGE